MERKIVSIAATSVLALICGSGSAMAQDTVLTLWHNGSCPTENCLVRSLAEGFVAANPGITIDIVEQPNDAYFTALLAASVTGSGPDLATMWAGGYITPYKPYLEDLRTYVAAGDIASSIGTSYYAEGGDKTDILYAVPTENQWYNGYYNKAILAANGITPPRTWDELTAACETLKTAGILPIINGPSTSEAQFQPLFEFAYLATALPIDQWNGLYDGTLAYSNPALLSQLERWNALYAAGCINEDAFNHPDTQAEFAAGGAAMYFSSGSWTIPDLTAAMGDDLGIMIPPFSDTPMQNIISLAGGGLVMMNYSDQKDAAGAFLAYVLSDAGQSLMAGITAPTRAGFPTTNPLINELVAMSTAPDWQGYPMFDNFSQPPVTDAIVRNMALVLVGEVSPADALAAADAAFASMPDDQKNVNYGLNAN